WNGDRAIHRAVHERDGNAMNSRDSLNCRSARARPTLLVERNTRMPRLGRIATLVLAVAAPVHAQNPTTTPTRDSVVTAARAPRVTYVPKTSRADTLRGSFTTPGRRW